NVFVSKREQGLAAAAAEMERERKVKEPPQTLLGSLFGWLGRRKRRTADPATVPETPAEIQSSVWQSMPRTNVDAPAVGPLAAAAAAVAPYAEALAAAAAPARDGQLFELPEMPPARAKAEASARSVAPSRTMVQPGAIAAKPDPATQAISFGKRADADIKPV